MSNVEGRNINDEQAREYDFNGRVYRIEEPSILYTRPGGTTHRVLDKSGVVHLVPAPGQFGCVVRWYPKNAQVPVAF